MGDGLIILGVIGNGGCSDLRRGAKRAGSDFSDEGARGYI